MEQTMYRVGDKAKVRKNLDVDRDYCMLSGPQKGNPSYGLVREMVCMGGEILTIANVNEDGWGYDVKENEWGWTDEMLEPVVSEFFCESLL